MMNTYVLSKVYSVKLQFLQIFDIVKITISHESFLIWEETVATDSHWPIHCKTGNEVSRQ